MCLGEGNGALLFGHDKLKMLITATSGHQRRGSGYKFGHHQLIVRPQYGRNNFPTERLGKPFQKRRI